MIRVLALLLVVGVWGVAAPAQTVEAPPVDEADAVPGFAAYRARLLEAVVARDIDAILSMAGADIHLSFGGESGRAALRAFLEVPPEDFAPANRHEAPALRERNWADLETVLRMGGRFDGDGRFIAPYPFTFDLPGGMDPFEALFVTGTGVALRAARSAMARFWIGSITRWCATATGSAARVMSGSRAATGPKAMSMRTISTGVSRLPGDLREGRRRLADDPFIAGD